MISLPLTLTLLLLTYLITNRITRYLRLAHIPGPLPAKITTLWLAHHQSTGSLARHLSSLSKTHGRIYRIAPEWVMTSSPAAIRQIWSARGPWYRGQWYDMFRFDQPVRTILSERDNTKHAALKAKLLPGYSGKDVDNLHEVVDRRVDDLVRLIERKYLSSDDGRVYKPMDLAEKAQFMTQDVISELAMGRCFECCDNDRDTYGQMTEVTGSLPLMVTLAVIPWTLNLLQNPVVRALLPKEKLEGVMRQQQVAKSQAAERFGEGKVVKRDMLGSFVKHGLGYTSAWLETFGQIGAGSDTTATAIRMTMFYLMSSPGSYGKLQREIDAAVSEGRVSSPVADEQAKKLPYLQAVMKEGMRLCPPVMGLLPRICDTEQVVCGVRIPPGTNVCWDAISIFRDEETFGADAGVFRPERWLMEGEDVEKRKNMDFVQGLVFGTSGQFECLEKTIALLELNKVFVELLRRFDFALVNPLTPVVSRDYSLSLQSQLWVRVTRRPAAL
ncbi:putative cytochrome P450 E-class, group I [Triangularia verruculosa]|uniref:Cytochrome P450 E-class, group I n=1 Tax=Triangularia verruculosa TaxID=2587418 RepID=A0AAN6XC13_9PEZI|nr:putative cytochrome P450 E-class, group I [Triangularia verruculosa]